MKEIKRLVKCNFLVRNFVCVFFLCFCTIFDSFAVQLQLQLQLGRQSFQRRQPHLVKHKTFFRGVKSIFV